MDGRMVGYQQTDMSECI